MISDVLTDAIQTINNLLDRPMYRPATFGDDNLLSDIKDVVGHMDKVRKKLDVPPVSSKHCEVQH